MSEHRDLTTVIADARSDVQALYRTGNKQQADFLAKLLKDVEFAAEPFVVWLTESEAMLKSGDSERSLRRRFSYLKECGLARSGYRGRREYLACAIARRPDIEAARAAGHEAVKSA